MEDKLFEVLDNLNIRDTKLLLDKDINLSLDSSTRKRIERSIKKKTGYYNENNIIINKINNLLGGIFMKKRIALALSVGAILSLGGGTYAYAKTPVAYVSLDINPSVELGVNAFDKVVSVEAYNDDGEKVLEGTNLINYDIDNAVSTVISDAISDGYIHADGSSAIEITTSTDKEKVATELEESLKNVADETLNNNDVEAEVETEKVALARRDEARKLGITPGKLNLIQKLQAIDPTINVEDYKSSSVKDIQKKTKELRKNSKSDEVTIDNSTNTEINTDTNADVVTGESTQEGTLSKTSVDSEEATVIERERNSNCSNNKDNAKKEEDSNLNSKQEEKSNGNEEKKTTTTTTQKQNNGNNVNSQENNNSSNSEKSNSSNSKSNNNSSSQNKGKSKNN
ncbi:MAG: hypothetical protein LLF98_08260 [Clostridium sp.]|uniref:anti-sigma-I factor RsgI family protein n=1 Tax=Clostridium sp. TaxID=1506 RepID=UPI0025B8D3DD|nr:hypothetical protein [Clostridium sp.]MCE5221248.1 hypothetical protein [Clostridium sp.]